MAAFRAGGGGSGAGGANGLNSAPSRPDPRAAGVRLRRGRGGGSPWPAAAVAASGECGSRRDRAANSARPSASREGRGEEALSKEPPGRGAPARSSPSHPSRVAPSVHMQATPPRVGLPLRSAPSAPLSPDPGGRGRGAASEPGTGGSKGAYDFRRVAIRRKPHVSYLLPGTPRPWSRPSTQPGWAETATFRIQPPADAPGKSLDGGRDERGALAQVRTRGPPRAKDARRRRFPDGCARPPTP